jgi:hypothetical protein
MKSIKEKAEEYTSDITNPVTNNAAFLAYKTGANYVLEKVERLLNSQKFVDNPSQELYKLIEQLKK